MSGTQAKRLGNAKVRLGFFGEMKTDAASVLKESHVRETLQRLRNRNFGAHVESSKSGSSK